VAKERTPEQIYDSLLSEGAYAEGNLDKNEISKVHRLAMEDYNYGKMLITFPNPNWRVIFNVHYDVLRELCDQLIRFKKIKTSNHQGVFAYIVLKYPELDFDWSFFELVRTMRNKNKYLGTDISKENWKAVEFQMNLCIISLDKWFNKHL